MPGRDGLSEIGINAKSMETLSGSLRRLFEGFEILHKELSARIDVEKPVSNSPKEYLCIGACKDCLCLIDFCHRAIRLFESETENENTNMIKIRSLGVEQELWTRKAIEHLVTLIAMRGKTEDDFRYYFSLTLLQSAYGKKKDEENFSWFASTYVEKAIPFNLGLIDGFRKKGVRLGELADENQMDNLSASGKNLIDAKKVNGLRSWENRFVSAVEKWTWHDRLLLWDFEMFYGNSSSKIHANLDYHYDDLSSHDCLERIEIHITRLLIRIGVYLQDVSGMPKTYFDDPETEAEYEASYRSIFQKEFAPGAKITCEIHGDGEIVERCLTPAANDYLFFYYRVRLDAHEEIIVPSPVIKFR